jgi:hypothetical protein
MTEDKRFNYQIHGYQSGHQLLSSSLYLVRSDQDTIDRLSDISGQIRPGEKFGSYLTCYPLPSEEYFVLARTWQDLNAPRAGCVVTKSILVPLTDWSTLDRIDLIFEELRIPPVDLRYSTEILMSTDDIRKLPDAPIDELVECLFLEKRQPVLVFDSPAQELIVKKLYSALWPGIRRNFACCTFALGPRSIGGRRFDLLFTKSDLRARFSDWVGRRVQGGIGLKKESRHRWTHELALRIFYSDRPSLMNEQSLPFFDQYDPDGENGLRLGLLWNELTAKAGSSPIAVLGLLDIINSRVDFPEELYRSVRPLILSVIRNAGSILGTMEAWRFYVALLSKHKSKPIGRDLFLQVKESCTHLAEKSPDEAINFVSSWEAVRERIPSMIFASIGDGISGRLLNGEWAIAHGIPGNITIQLVSASKQLASAIMNLYIPRDNNAAFFLTEQILEADRSTSKRARNNLALYIHSIAHAKILSMLLTIADLGDYQRIIRAISRNTEFELREFDNEILKATAERSQFRFLLDELVKFSNSNGGRILLVQALSLAPDLITYFINSDKDITIGHYEVLKALLVEANTNVIESIARNSQLSYRVFHSFLSDRTVGQLVPLTVAIRSGLPASDIVANVASLGTLNEVDGKSLEGYLLSQLRTGSVQELEFLSTLISQLEIRSAKTLLNRLFLNKAIGVDAGRIFRVFFGAGPTFQLIMMSEIDLVSEILTKSLAKEYDRKVVECLLFLFYGTSNSEKSKKAAVCLVDYSFKQVRIDPTELLLAAFPIVYNAYLNSQPVTHYFSFFFFSDWDKCKTLRHDLATRYMNSRWSNFGLFQVAARAGILDETFSIVKENKGGKKYIEMAMRQARAESFFDGQGIKEFRKFMEDLYR